MSGARPTNGRLYLLLSLMVTFWSFNYVVAKLALREFPPVLLVGVRTLMAGVILLPMYIWREGTNGEVWKWREMRLLIPLGIGGVVLNQFLFVVGLARTSVAHAAIAIAITPILVLTIAIACGQERASVRRLAGMAIAFAGVMVVQLGKSSGSKATLAGDLCVMAGALSLAAFTVFGKAASLRHGGIAVNTIAYVGGALAFTPVILWQSANFQFSHVSPLAWLSVFYMAAFSSVISYLIYYYALTHISASQVAGFSYLQPVLATLMAIPVLRESVGTGLLVGGSLTLAGVYVSERS